MLDDLIAAELRPRTLFEEGTERRNRLMTAIYAVFAVTAAQRFDRKWLARADSKSPGWTTRLAEVSLISARR